MIKRIIITGLYFFIALSLSAQLNFCIELNSFDCPIQAKAKRQIVVTKYPNGDRKKTYDIIKDVFIQFPNKNNLVVYFKGSYGYWNLYEKEIELKKENYHAILHKAIDDEGEECIVSNVIENGVQFIHIEYDDKIVIYE